jgi:hypothetical protein
MRSRLKPFLHKLWKRFACQLKVLPELWCSLGSSNVTS